MLLALALVLVMLTMGSQMAFATSSAQPSDDAISVSTSDGLIAVFQDLSTNGGSKEVKLESDIEVEQILALEKGELTIFGEGHYLNISGIYIRGTAVLNLGVENYEKTLQIKSAASSTMASLIECLESSTTLNMYANVTIGPSTSAGSAGAVSIYGTSVFNMYGGVIAECISEPTAGAVQIMDEGTFNMYDGLITKCKSDNNVGAVGIFEKGKFIMYGGTISECSGVKGGAIGFMPPGAIGASVSASNAVFTMNSGTIENCTSSTSGGAIYDTIESTKTTITINDGIIRNCTAEKYGGAIYMETPQTTSETNINGGTFTGNKAKYGGAICLVGGKLRVKGASKVYDNIATIAGDDVYSDNSLYTGSGWTPGFQLLVQDMYNQPTLSCGHKVDAWYIDTASSRWCADGEDTNINKFTKTGYFNSSVVAIKAAHDEIYFIVVYTDGTDNEEIFEDQYYKVIDGQQTPSFSGTPTRQCYRFTGWQQDTYQFEVEYVVYTATWEEDHDWLEPTYDWSEDKTECIATRVCANDASHKQTDIATVDIKETTAATCTAEGTMTYTAIFTVDWATTQTVTSAIPKKDHDYGHDWEADEDNHWHECTVCKDKTNEAEHIFKWVIDKEAAVGEEGLKHEECEICGYAKAPVKIPALSEQQEPSVPQTGDNSNMTLWIALLVVSICGIAGTFMCGKKKKHNA